MLIRSLKKKCFIQDGFRGTVRVIQEIANIQNTRAYFL